MSEAIVCSALTKTFTTRSGTLTAVDHLDLNVREGEIFGLLGPNGAGKTTTVGMLTTRVIPTGGTAVVGDVDVVRDPALVKQLIGVVPQTNTLDRSLNVRENLYFHGRYFGLSARMARARTDELLQQFKLTEKATAETITLSGGMAQRLMVARAMLHHPHVLFLDEPTSGLDPQSRLALWDVVETLRAGGQTVLLTTHYMEEADVLCDRLAIVDHGQLLTIGTPGELKAGVEADATIRVRVDGDATDGLARVSDVTGVERAEVLDGAITAYIDGPPGTALARIAAALAESSTTITDVEITEPTLETVFIGLTGKELRE